MRNKLGEAFIEDLRDAWLAYGANALARCATEEPSQFCKIVASLLPKDFNNNLGVDAETFVQTFRAARQLLGNDDPPRLINGR